MENERKNNYKAVIEAAEAHLQMQNCTTPEKTLSGPDLWLVVKDKVNEISKNTVIQYLSYASRDQKTNLYTQGVRQGYYYKKDEPNIEMDDVGAETLIYFPKDATPQKIKIGEKERQKEKQLYSIFVDWLKFQGYRSADVSNNKSGGKWGNPDVAGLLVTEAFGNLFIDVVTVEVKISENDWEQWIFEAISHRRFANRSYFAFTLQESKIGKYHEDIKYYSDVFHVGVICIAIDDDLYNKFLGGEQVDFVANENYQIIEINSAVYNHVPIGQQMKFINGIGIGSMRDLLQWGD